MSTDMGSFFAPGVDQTLARMFAENIETTKREMENIEDMAERASVGEGEFEQMHGDGCALISDGLYLLLGQKEASLKGLEEGLAECELIIEANRVMHALDAMYSFVDDDKSEEEVQTLQDAIALIHRLDAERKKSPRD